MWRAIKDSLPTKQILQHRHIMMDEACSLCEESKGTIMHNLWYCEQAQAIWKSERSFVDLYQKHHRTFMDVFKGVIKEGSAFRIAWFSTIAWSLWQWRNRIRENQTTWPLLEIGRRAKAQVEEFFEVHRQASRTLPRPAPVWWALPMENWYKANFDAALFKHLGMAGLGVVFRDSTGNLIAALSQKILRLKQWRWQKRWQQNKQTY